jgi:hypothetical protein
MRNHKKARPKPGFLLFPEALGLEVRNKPRVPEAAVITEG